MILALAILIVVIVLTIIACVWAILDFPVMNCKNKENKSINKFGY